MLLKDPKISVEFHLYLGHPKLSTTINLLNQPMRKKGNLSL
jgi:hypothetical protein